MASDMIKQLLRMLRHAQIVIIAALDRRVDDIEEVRAMNAQTDDIKKRTVANPGAKELQATVAAVLKRCDELDHRMHNPEAEVAYDVLAGRQGALSSIRRSPRAGVTRSPITVPNAM